MVATALRVRMAMAVSMGLALVSMVDGDPKLPGEGGYPESRPHAPTGRGSPLFPVNFRKGFLAGGYCMFRFNLLFVIHKWCFYDFSTK